MDDALGEGPHVSRSLLLDVLEAELDLWMAAANRFGELALPIGCVKVSSPYYLSLLSRIDSCRFCGYREF